MSLQQRFLTFFLGIIFTLPSSIYSQEKQLSVKQGPLFEHEYRSNNVIVPQPEYGNGYVSVRRHEGIEKYDSSGARIAVVGLIPDEYDKGYQFLSAISSGKGIYGLYTNIKKKEAKRVTYKQELDWKTLKPIGAPIEIGAVDIVKGKKIFTEKDEVLRSKRGSRIALVSYPPNPTDAGHKMNVKVFDNECNEISSNSIQFVYIEKFSKRILFEVDEQGNVIEIRKVFKNRDDYGDDENYELKLFKLDTAGTLSDCLLSMDGYRIDKLDMFSADENIYVGGLFDNHFIGTPRSIGVYQFKIDKGSMEIVKNSKATYSPEFITTNYNDKVRNSTIKDFNANEDAAMCNLEMLDIQINSRGETLILSEINFARFSSSGAEINFARFSSSGDYRGTMSADMILTKFSSEGNVLWSNIYKKRQSSIDQRFNGAIMMVNDNEAALFFNDNSENYNVTSEENEMSNYTLKKNACVGAVIVNLKDGSYTRESIQSNDGIGYYMHLDAMANNLDNELILYLTNSKNARYSKVGF